MDRALAALHVCAEKLRKRNVHLARSVATEACRRASNGAEFIERVHRETGIRLNIITAQEEARLAVLGCHILLEHGDGPAMIFDIGGDRPRWCWSIRPIRCRASSIGKACPGAWSR
jgi:exopolyphosphatase/guanosine-5'-triphosphate,3'-diphosphate pyrophosphatase